MILSQLHRLGVLGINNRVGRYILRHNKRKFYPYVDNKVLTSELAHKWGISTPENYMVIKNYGTLRTLDARIAHLDSFVIKPAKGSQGNGIIVITEVIKKEVNGKIEIQCRRSNGKIMEIDEVKHHISGILSGLYSLGGQNDEAIIQSKIEMHPVFNDYSYGGIPDIRVIVFQGYPVMSMVRLPTKSSDGRANLHQGAIGAGITLATGTINHAVIGKKLITHHPDTGNEIKHLLLPHWREILDLSAKCYDMVGLGYLGADIVITPDKGPVMLELNARPGLGIQIANLSGLVPRLELIAAHAHEKRDYKERVDFSMKHFI